MLLAKETVEEAIVTLLRARELKGSQLHAALARRGHTVSYQAVFNALKKLLQQEVVLKKKTYYGLNYVWLKRLAQFSSATRPAPGVAPLFPIEDMSEGDRVTYNFDNLNKAGAFWMHVHQILLDSLKPRQVAVLYSTVEWTSLVREAQDTEWARTAAKTDKLTLFAIGRANAHDRAYKSQHESGNLIIQVGKSYGFHSGYYLNVFNDFVVELTVPTSVGDQLEALFAAAMDSKVLANNLLDSGLNASPVQLVIKKNHTHAHRLFKKIAKDFYIPRGYSSPHLG